MAGSPELGARARSGLLWSLLNSGAARILNVIAGLIIARVVTPEEFGTYAAALLVMTVVLSMNEIGISVAVIRWGEGVERVVPTAVTASFASSVVWFALMLLGAPLLAEALGAPQASAAIQVLAVSVLLDGVSTIPNALLMRAFQQRRRAAAELGGFLVGTPIGIYLASSGGAVGLAIGLLISNAVATAVILRLAPLRTRPGWDRATAVELVRIGLPPAMTSLLLLAIVNLDTVVVSRELGVAALGFYTLAFNVANWPWNLLSKSIRQVSLPAFSRLAEDPEGPEEAFSHSLTLAGGLAVLGGVLLAALATPLVGILYGEEWLAAVVALQWLAALGAMRVVLELCYDLLIAVGRAGALVRIQLVWLAALLVALPVGARVGGIGGVAIAQSIVAVALVLPLNLALLNRAGVRIAVLGRSLWPVASATAAGAVVALAVLWAPLSDWLTLLAGGLLISAAYLAAFWASARGRSAVHWARPSTPADTAANTGVAPPPSVTAQPAPPQPAPQV